MRHDGWQREDHGSLKLWPRARSRCCHVGMGGSDLGPTVLSLVGVLLGTAGTLVAQLLATRASSERERIARLAELQAERKEAIREFLAHAQLVEHLAERRFQHGEFDPVEAEPLTHQMWFLQRCIELVGSPELRKAAENYVLRLHDVVYRELPRGRDVWDHMAERREPFLDAARKELGVADLPPSGSQGLRSPGARPTAGRWLPGCHGSRCQTVGGEGVPTGRSWAPYSLHDLMVLPQQAGLEGWDALDVAAHAELIEWRGGGPHVCESWQSVPSDVSSRVRLNCWPRRRGRTRFELLRARQY